MRWTMLPVLPVLAVLGAGCLEPSATDVAPRPWIWAGPDTFHLEAPWVEGDLAVVLRFDAAGTASCTGAAFMLTMEATGMPMALLDTAHTSYAYGDYGLVAFRAGQARAGYWVAPGPFLALEVDEENFEGTRELWFVFHGAAQSEDGSLLGGVELDVGCPGANLTSAWAGRSVAALGWRSADAHAVVFGDGAAVHAVPTTIEVAGDGAGMLALFPDDGAGASIVETPVGANVHNHEDGFLLELLPPGASSLRSVGVTRPPLGVLASAAPVQDWASLLGAPTTLAP